MTNVNAKSFAIENERAPMSPASPVTTVITRVVAPEHEVEYAEWLPRMLNQGLSYPKSLGAAALTPDPAHEGVHHLGFSFSDLAASRAWLDSPGRRALSEEADAFSTSRLDAGPAMATWFATPAAPSPAPPALWKMALATFVVAYVLTAIIIPREQAWLPATWSFYVVNVITSLLLALAITYVAIPVINRLLQR